MELNLTTARLTNKNARFVGISVNTKDLGEQESIAYLAGLQTEFDLPAVDPFRAGVSTIVDLL